MPARARAEQEQARADQLLVVLRETLLSLLQARGLSPTGDQLSEVSSCSDPQRLRRWFERALSGADAAAVFNDS